MNTFSLFLLSMICGGAVFGLVYGWGLFSAGKTMQTGVRLRLVDYGAESAGASRFERSASWLEKMLLRTPLGKRVRTMLDEADLQWSVLLFATGVAVLFVLVYCALHLLLGLAAWVNTILSVAAAIGLSSFFLVERRGAYERALRNQIPDVALLLSNSLKAGQSLYFALGEVEEKMPRPANYEFGSIRKQIDLGKSMDAVLRNFLEAHPSEEMRIMITSLLIQRKAGGDLITTLASISAAIQGRRRIRHEVDTIVAQAKQTSVIVVIMPFVVLIILNQLSPGLVADFLAEWWGLPFFFIAYILPQVCAFFAIRKVGDVKV